MLTGARILIVDDHYDLADNVREIVEEEGATAAHAATAAAGLELAEREQFDVALVDIRLPDDKGLNLVPRIKQTGDGMVEALLITGDALLEDAIAAVQSGAYDYVLKPFDPNHLLASIERALNQVRSRRETVRLSAALETSERSLRTLVDAVQALLVVFDQEGTILRANAAASAAFGRSADELVGQSFFSLLPSAEVEPTRRHLPPHRAALRKARRRRCFTSLVNTAV